MPLDNRELASLLLIALLVGLAARDAKTRTRLGGLARAVASPGAGLVILLFLTYVWCLTSLGAAFGLWHSGLLKATVVWTVTVAVVMLLNLNKVMADRKYIRRVVVETVSIVTLLEFIAGMATLTLWAEVAIQAALGALAVVSALARHRGVHGLHKAASTLLAIGGLSLLANSIVWTVRAWPSLDFRAVALEAVLPVWLTLGFIPFIFTLAVYSSYQRPMRQISRYGVGPKANRLRARLALVLGFSTNGHRLVGFGPYEIKAMLRAPSLRAALRVTRDHITQAERRDRAAEEQSQRLKRYAGVKGTDERGRQLDQREFASTKKALEFLATCHQGHYDQVEGYREDMLTIAMIGFDDLPEQHGITMRLSADGQAWWAWRRCITGWCFAIGATGPPPGLWRYDGPEPPIAAPGLDPRWGAEPGQGSRHW